MFILLIILTPFALESVLALPKPAELNRIGNNQNWYLGPDERSRQTSNARGSSVHSHHLTGGYGNLQPQNHMADGTLLQGQTPTSQPGLYEYDAYSDAIPARSHIANSGWEDWNGIGLPTVQHSETDAYHQPPQMIPPVSYANYDPQPSQNHGSLFLGETPSQKIDYNHGADWGGIPGSHAPIAVSENRSWRDPKTDTRLPQSSQMDPFAQQFSLNAGHRVGYPHASPTDAAGSSLMTGHSSIGEYSQYHPKSQPGIQGGHSEFEPGIFGNSDSWPVGRRLDITTPTRAQAKQSTQVLQVHPVGATTRHSPSNSRRREDRFMLYGGESSKRQASGTSRAIARVKDARTSGFDSGVLPDLQTITFTPPLTQQEAKNVEAIEKYLKNPFYREFLHYAAGRMYWDLHKTLGETCQAANMTSRSSRTPEDCQEKTSWMGMEHVLIPSVAILKGKNKGCLGRQNQREKHRTNIPEKTTRNKVVGCFQYKGTTAYLLAKYGDKETIYPRELL